MKNKRVAILLISTLLLFVGFVAFRVVSNKEKTKQEVEAELNKYINLHADYLFDRPIIGMSAIYIDGESRSLNFYIDNPYDFYKIKEKYVCKATAAHCISKTIH